MIRQNRVKDFYNNPVRNIYHNHHENRSYVPMDELPDYCNESYIDGYRHGSNFLVAMTAVGFVLGVVLAVILR